MKVHHLQDLRDHQKSVSKNLKPRGQKVSQVKVRRDLARQEAKVNPRRRAELVQLRPHKEWKEEPKMKVMKRVRVRDIPDVEGDLSAVILDHREMFLASIEDQDEPVCEEKISLPPELQDEAATWVVLWWYQWKSVGTAKESSKLEEMRLKIIETMKVWEKIPRSQIPPGMKTIWKPDGSMWTSRTKRTRFTGVDW